MSLPVPISMSQKPCSSWTMKPEMWESIFQRIFQRYTRPF